ncbi:cupin domain-containing protein [Paenibacillus sp. CC-CFT747]|nr:cupin domain-containing protein [Paenibacillus sp. CC-CFT747]
MNISTYFFEDDGQIPNNPDLPVLLYAGAFREDPVQAEARFNLNNWRNSWVNGVFPYHHYHSNSHEVLGVLKGSALLVIGGEKGKEIKVQAGDVLVLPAGTGHKKLRSSADFSVAGAYPEGMSYNTKTGEAGERSQVLEDIKRVPLPNQDPIFGDEGPLQSNWKKK